MFHISLLTDIKQYEMQVLNIKISNQLLICVACKYYSCNIFYGKIQDVPIPKYDPMNFLYIPAKFYACIIYCTIVTPSRSTISSVVYKILYNYFG